MKHLFFMFFLIIIQIKIIGQKEVIINTFNDEKNKGYLKELNTDSICILQKSVLLNNCFNVEDISNIEIIDKKDNENFGTLIGIAIGSIPGLILMSKFFENSIDGLFAGIIGIPVGLAGAIGGGVIGYQTSKGAIITIPINGNKKLYEKQKLKLQQYTY